MSSNPLGAELFSGFYNINDPARASELVAQRVADDFVDHSPAFGAPATKEGFGHTVAFINSAFRQRYDVQHLISENDRHVAIWRAEVAHVGQFMHLPASHKTFSITGITAYELGDGLITAHWEQFDVLAILTALGIVPPLGAD